MKILLLNLDLESKNTPCTKFEQDQANILENMQVSSFFYSATHSQQKVAMATPEINKNCHYEQNNPHKCRIKLGKFLFDILCFFGVIKESLPRAECYMDWFPSLICKNYIFKHFVKTVEPTSLKFCTILKLVTLHLE